MWREELHWLQALVGLFSICHYAPSHCDKLSCFISLRHVWGSTAATVSPDKHLLFPKVVRLWLTVAFFFIYLCFCFCFHNCHSSCAYHVFVWYWSSVFKNPLWIITEALPTSSVNPPERTNRRNYSLLTEWFSKSFFLSLALFQLGSKVSSKVTLNTDSVT